MALVTNRSRKGFMTPLIACGAARSGTTMLMDILNCHENIAVQDEMHIKTLEAYFQMTKEIDKVFDHYSAIKNEKLDEHWRSSISSLTHCFLTAANKVETKGAGKEILFHGIKTPGYEAYFSDFERVFEGQVPMYLYSVRAVEKVWRSWKTIGFLDDVLRFKARYERSLRHAVKLRNRAKERFILFDLEKYIRSEDKVSYVNHALFKPLGLVFEGECEEALHDLGRSNTLKNKGFDSYSTDERLEEEMEMLASCPKIQEFKAKLLE